MQVWGEPADEDNLDLGSDTDTDSEAEENPVNIVPDHDPVLQYVHEIITGIRRLSPSMRELAKSQIRLILQRYLRPDYDEPRRVPPSVPRVSQHG